MFKLYLSDHFCTRHTPTRNDNGLVSLDEQGRQAMLRRYREQVRRESENNAMRWARMTPAEKARYPEPVDHFVDATNMVRP